MEVIECNTEVDIKTCSVHKVFLKIHAWFTCQKVVIGSNKTCAQFGSHFRVACP